MSFVHLHVHTEFSLLDGINRINTLPQHIKSIGQKSVAITDHGNLSGCYKFVKECKKNDVQPIVGIEAYYCVGDRHVHKPDDDDESYYHLVLLAKNDIGLKNLFKISTYAYTEGMYHKPRCDDDLLSQYSEGIMATSACLGSRVSQLILGNRSDQAERLLLHHAQIFKDNFFLELQLHEGKEQQAVNAELVRIGQKYNLPLILTNDCHYTKEEDKLLHEQALCMQTNKTFNDPKRMTFGDIDVHVASHDWMWTRAQKHGLPYEAISNTVHIASMVNHKDYFSNVHNKYPKFKDLPDGVSSWEALEHLSKNALTAKFNGMPPLEYRVRLMKELKLIKKMGFYDYLLIVQDFINDARANNIYIGPGRGSGAGCLVAYALGITQIDPIRYGLITERWLNYGRAATPLLLTEEHKALAK